MARTLKEQMHDDFLLLLQETLRDKKKLNIAVKDRKGALLDGKPIGISTLDDAGIFNEDGEINPSRAKDANITFDKDRLSMSQYGLQSLSFRERLLLDSAISSAHNALMSKYSSKLNEVIGDDDEALLTEFRDTFQQTPRTVIEELRHAFPRDGNPRKYHLMTPHNNYLVHAPILQAMNHGFYSFQNTNVIISPGPTSIIQEGSNEDDRKLSRFYHNLKKNNVTQVFAIGRVFPYHPQDGMDERRDVLRDVVSKEDFSNYFLPDMDGNVKLPSPDYDDFKVTSKAIEKVGRITTYEISINNGAPIHIHHLPLNDKQPLELSDDELAYVRDIQRKTPRDQNLLTHCRGGRGRSAQMAYILSANTPTYAKAPGEAQLQAMRLEKCGGATSSSFVETDIQERYLGDLAPKLASPIDAYQKEPSTTFNTYVLLDLLFREEIERVKHRLGELIPANRSAINVAELAPEAQDYAKFLEKYHQLNLDMTEEALFATLKETQALSCASETFKRLPTNDYIHLIKHQLPRMLTHSLQSNTRPENRTFIYDAAARELGYAEAKMILLSPLFKLSEETDIAKLDSAIALLHLNQAYLRRYKTDPLSMEIDCKAIIATDLQNEINELYKFVAQIKNELREQGSIEVPSRQAWVHWQEHVAVLKETLKSYEDIIGPLLSEEERSVFEKLAGIIDKSPDEALIALSRPAPIGAMKKAKDYFKEIHDINKAWSHIQASIKTNTASIEDPAEVIAIAQITFAEMMVHIENTDDTLSRLSKHQLETLSQALATLSPDEDVPKTRKKVLHLMARAFSDMQNQVDLRESFATEASKAALESAAKRDKSEKINTDNAEILHDITAETEQALKNIEAMKQANQAFLEHRLALSEVKQVGIEVPLQPKMIIFDVDDTLVDLDTKGIKNKEALFDLLRKLHEFMPTIEIGICTNRVEQIDQDTHSNGGYTIKALLAEIERETGIIINPEYQLLYSADIQKGVRAIEMSWDEARKQRQPREHFERLIMGKNFQMDELRLRYQKMHGTLPRESECLFVDDSPNIVEQMLATRNFSVVKVPEKRDKSRVYLTEIAYKSGFYSPLIRFLQGVGPVCDTEAIPNFKEMGFKHTPIVKEVALDDFLTRVGVLVGEDHQENLRDYKYDFTLEAVEQFSSLSPDFQNRAAVAAFNYMQDEMRQIEASMIQQLPPSEGSSNTWKELSERLERLIVLEKKYTEKIGLCYLDIDLQRLKTCLQSDVSALRVLEAEGVKSIELNNPAQATQLSQASLFNANLLMDKTTHPALQDTEQLRSQKDRYTTQLEKLLKLDLAKFKKEASEEQPTLMGLIDRIAEDIEELREDEIIKRHANHYSKKLTGLLSQIEELSALVPSAVFLDKHRGIEAQPYTAKLAELRTALDALQHALHDDEEYKAMLFLERAERYILSNDRGWNETNRPKHVVKQLAEINEAKEDGNYENHKRKFIDIGRKEAKSIFSILFSSEYNKLFFDKSRGVEASDKDLDDSFQNRPRNTPR